MLDVLFAPWLVQGVGASLVLLVAGRTALACVDSLRRIRHGRVAFDAAQQRLHWRVEQEKLRFEKAREQAALTWEGYRKFEVRRIARNEDETGHIASFYLYPHDGKALPTFHPGQFLTFRLRIEGQPREVVRCYSLSDKPQADHYRISVKRVPGGLVSTYLHEQIREGDILDVRAPGGRFYLDLTETWPVVLIAGGVGITPVLSMYNAIAAEQPSREVWFLYAARHGGEFIMKDHLAQLSWWCTKAQVYFCYSDPTDGEKRSVLAAAPAEGERVHHVGGRINGEFMRAALPPGAAETHHFYMCGPPPMMDAVIADLKAWGVAESQIHTEAFGAKGVKAAKPPAEAPAAASGPVYEVSFSRSGKVAPWDGTSGSLLEFAEKQGVQIEAGCCAGDCHTCATAVKAGDVTYLRELAEKPEKGTCLPCVAVPKSNLILDA